MHGAKVEIRLLCLFNNTKIKIYLKVIKRVSGKSNQHMLLFHSQYDHMASNTETHPLRQATCLRGGGGRGEGSLFTNYMLHFQIPKHLFTLS